MTRDFASKSKKRSNATRFNESVKESNTNFVVMILCLVLGIAITLTAVYFYYNAPTEAPTQTVAEIAKPPSAKNRYKAVPADEIEESEFEYHKELPKKKIEIEVEPLPEIKSNATQTYVMQCGSFRQMSRAENLKAQIALTGFEARIRSSRNDEGHLWHRVVLGPYQSKRLADQDRHDIQRNTDIDCRIW